MIQYHDYLTIYNDGKNYQIPKVTKHHMQWCKEGRCIIIDLKNNRDCIRGTWTKKLKIESDVGN